MGSLGARLQLPTTPGKATRIGAVGQDSGIAGSEMFSVDDVAAGTGFGSNHSVETTVTIPASEAPEDEEPIPLWGKNNC